MIVLSTRAADSFSDEELPEPAFETAQMVLNEAPARGHGLALDKAPARERMTIARARLTKASIGLYLGDEIVGWQDLDLVANRRYRMLRCPQELARAVPTFNLIPVLNEHDPNCYEHPERALGAIGRNAVFEAPYIVADMILWAPERLPTSHHIQVAAAYRYRADMTPGRYQGEPYDAVMRDIIGHHIALMEWWD